MPHTTAANHTGIVVLGMLVLSLAAATAPTAGAVPAEPSSPQPLRTTGKAVPELAPFDRLIPELMRKHEIPGGALAVAKDGRLLLARGYGLADVEKNEPVRPDDLFRIASISKPFTAATILKLLQQGQLELDAKAVDLLEKIEPPPGKSIEPKFRQITIRQLLHHVGGFDRGQSLDPMFYPAKIAQAVGMPAPADSWAIIRFMSARPLDFEPGQRYAYSNFGYCLLGRVIEHVTGKRYEEAVGTLVLQPAGIYRMQTGRTQLADRAVREVRYYMAADAELVASVFPNVRQPVPHPYGGFYLEPMDSHGGWIASTIDLLRFAMALDGRRKPALLKPETVALITSPPMPTIVGGRGGVYGLGWAVVMTKDGPDLSHAGSLPGACSLLVRTHDGTAWAALFNFLPQPDLRFLRELDVSLYRAARDVEHWPTHDLFPQFP